VPEKLKIYLPILFAIMLAVGIFIGSWLSPGNKISPLASKNYAKVNEILNYIEDQYVDTIDRKTITDKAITSLLLNLDPHSSYIPSEDLKDITEPLEGQFDGVGIEFNILQDTIIVVSPIAGGPSEIVGIKPGDRIIKVGDKNVAGVKIKNKEVFNLLRGTSGTKISVEVLRRGRNKILPFTITRGKIPIYSVDIAYMLDDKTGFIKITRFAATTFEEYKVAFLKLKKLGLENLILDLRTNPGGYLNAAIHIADEFLENGKLIVYTEGKARPKQIYKATTKGDFEKGKLVILVDEGSASASEIVAGAVQDNDRGTIMGRRSFGKGLVQEQMQFTDGSAMRLTIAKYFTPTGRSIQKSYSEGFDAYFEEDLKRLEKGELIHPDSIKFNDSLIFKTPGGKIVYGGGGIMPDIFVPFDSTGRTEFVSKVLFSGLVSQFALKYMDTHRTTLSFYKTFNQFNSEFETDSEILNDFYEFAVSNGIKKSKVTKFSEDMLKTQIKAYIARNLWSNEGFYPVFHQLDYTLRKALDVIYKED